MKAVSNLFLSFTVSAFIVPKLRPSVQKVLDNALQGNETSNYELEFETKKKEIRYLLGELWHYLFM
jgi:hypothetical protein